VPLLPRFRSVHPELELDLLLSDTVLDLIAERVDLAIRLGPRLDTGFVGTQLMRTRYRVCASPSYVARAAKLRRPQIWPHMIVFSSRFPAIARSGNSATSEAA